MDETDETGSDRTESGPEDYWSTLYTSPEKQRIEWIVWGTEFFSELKESVDHQFTSKDPFIESGRRKVVSRWEVLGDRNGDDVGRGLTYSKANASLVDQRVILRKSLAKDQPCSRVEAPTKRLE